MTRKEMMRKIGLCIQFYFVIYRIKQIQVILLRSKLVIEIYIYQNTMKNINPSDKAAV